MVQHEHEDPEEPGDAVEIGPAAALARVRYVSEDRCHLHLELRSGAFAQASSNAPFTVDVGELLLVLENSYELAPRELWPDENVVGVVKLKHSEITVIDTGARWLPVPTTVDPIYETGNTVEAHATFGVLRVLSETPIRHLDHMEIDETIIKRFMPPVATDLSFDDFGGPPEIVDRARRLVEVSLAQGEQIAAIGARPIKGVLFTGPPGTGKTMLARIVAKHSGAKFYEISGPTIFSKWYGESEEILRFLFDHAATHGPSLVFIDEIDSVAGQRDADAHEASRRVVAQLLTLMDGFKVDDRVVVIAATNRPDAIDFALRRPGRFDWEIEFRLPTTRIRQQILRAAARRHQAADQLPHKRIAEKTEGWSGADLAAIWTEAALLTVADKRSQILVEDFLGGYQQVAAQKAQQSIGVIA
jgi:transitional endoplasmic reticulum ATPase